MRTLPVFLLATLAALLSFTTVHAATEYLVITTDALAPAFQDLASQKSARGHETELITIEELSAIAVPGRDVAEQIRTYIQTVYAGGSLRFVILGGDTGQVPTRYAFTEFYPAGGSAIPTDLYFAALDGNWDANGNDVFCEVYVDAADLGPEVAVGRVPARTPLEASQYVAKLSEFEDPDNTHHRDSALFLGEVLFPADWQPADVISLDGADFGEELRAIIQSGDSPMADQRLYENHLAFPDATQLSRAQAIATMNSGDHGLVLHLGHGYQTSLSMGDEILNPEDALALTNGPHHFVLMSSVSEGAAFDIDPILENFIRNPDGGAVAVIGLSKTSFPASTQAYFREFNEQIFVMGASSLGEALNAVRTVHDGDAQDTNVWRYTQLAVNLLGDPEVSVKVSPVVTEAPVANPGCLRFTSVTPNPFNPLVTIRFELLGDLNSSASVTVSVFDPAGRRVRTLWNGILDQGPHQRVWDGRDDAGAALSSGVYFATIESGGERRSAKMVLLK
jgi:hypothetical protein